MTSQTRLEKIKKKLNLEEEELPLFYWAFLMVGKEKTFEEASKEWRINVNQGKERFLGQNGFDELPPAVKDGLKKVYIETQEEIKDNPNTGGAFVFFDMYN